MRQVCSGVAECHARQRRTPHQLIACGVIGVVAHPANQILAAKKVSPGNPEQMLIIAKHEAKLAAMASDASDPAAAELLEQAIQTVVALTNANMIDREELSHSDFDLVRKTPAIHGASFDAVDTKVPEGLP